jgi:hypothetical protein
VIAMGYEMSAITVLMIPIPIRKIMSMMDWEMCVIPMMITMEYRTQ